MTRRRAVRVAAGTTIAAVLALGLTAPPASAAWQTTVSAPAFPLSAASLGTPTTSCTTVSGTLGLVDSVRISWAAVPEAKKYRVTYGSTSPVSQETTALSVDITGTLLLTLLGSALFGTSTTVTVTALDENWVSGPSTSHTIVLSNVVSGLLGGVRCQN